MKPIHLAISGLNSFKKEQHIDFEKLTDLGMFGIFGNTGSGKSTILDAITLALFGTVVRADNKKQGIINHSETKLQVSFTFALGAGSQRRLYRADRAYKTKDHITVQGIRSLLTDITENQEIVIAEKETDVTAKIEALLGMKADDFTRAVVLPQGSFADFLKMKPSERRSMLERLFSLEKYGRQLTEKVSSRYQSANLKFSRLDGEQQGLGQATVENVAAAKQRKTAAQEQEQHAEAILASATVHHEETSNIYRLQEELAAKETALANHRLDDSVITALGQEVERAEDAAVVEPLLKDRSDMEGKVREAEGKCRTLETAVQTMQEEARLLTDALQKAKQTRLQEEPALLERKAKLEGARVTEGEAAKLTELVKEWEDKIQTDEANLALTADEIRSITASLETVTATIAELEQEIKGATVSPEYRQLLEQAGKKSDSLQRELAEVEKCRADYKNRKSDYNDKALKAAAAKVQESELEAAVGALQEREEQARQSPPADETTLAGQEFLLSDLKRRMGDLTAKTAKLATDGRDAYDMGSRFAQGQTAQKVAESAWQEAQAKVQQLMDEQAVMVLGDRQAMADMLAANLQSSQPCPVCGSTHHPSLATGQLPLEAKGVREEIDVALAAAKEYALETEKTFRQVENQVISLQTKWESVQEHIRAVADELKAEMAELTAAWQVAAGEAPLVALAALADQKGKDLADLQAALKGWRIERERAEKELREQEKELSDCKSIIAGLTAALTAAAGEMNRLQEEGQQFVSSAAAADGDLTALLEVLGLPALGDCTRKIAIVEEQKEDIKRRDQLVERLQVVLSQKRSNQNNKLVQREQLRQKEQQVTGNLASLRSSQGADKMVLTEKQAALCAITQGRPVTVLLEEVRTSLYSLAQTEQRAQEQYDTSQAALDQYKTNLTISRTQLIGLEEQWLQIKNRVAEKLTALSFASEADVRAACRDKAFITNARKQIKDHGDETTLLSSQREELIAKLDGRTVNPEAWEQSKDELAAAKAAKEGAKEERITAEQLCLDIESRHVRWQALEDELLIVRQELQHLTAMQGLLRGNAFVEFMAQEQMDVVVRHASDRLKELTQNRYALELASDGSFIIRDDDNAGAKRPVNMLSGGETFQTSLALALALSTQIQLKGEHPLEFFFLDEGFGTLDQKLLETVMTSLERLPLERMTIGLISHVEALKQRLLRRLIVEGAEPNGKGTTVRIEIA